MRDVLSVGICFDSVWFSQVKVLSQLWFIIYLESLISYHGKENQRLKLKLQVSGNLTTDIRHTSVFVYLLFYILLKNFSLVWRRHHCWWRAAKFMQMLGAQGLWSGRNLLCATHAVTRCLGFSCLIWMTAPFSRLLQHTRGSRGPILT
jgi:hypothetical protein